MVSSKQLVRFRPNTCYPLGSYCLQSLCNRLLSVCPRSALMHRSLQRRPCGAADLLLMAEAPHFQRWRLRELQPRRRLPPWPAPWQSIATACSSGDDHAFNTSSIIITAIKSLPVRRRREQQRQRWRRQPRLWGRWWPHLLDSAGAAAASAQPKTTVVASSRRHGCFGSDSALRRFHRLEVSEDAEIGPSSVARVVYREKLVQKLAIHWFLTPRVFV